MKKRLMYLLTLMLVLGIATIGWAASADPVEKCLLYSNTARSIQVLKPAIPLGALKNFRFNLVDSTGAVVHSETEPIRLSGYIFSHDICPADSVDFSRQLWLKVEVENGGVGVWQEVSLEMFQVVPYALWSAASSQSFDAATLDGFDSTYFAPNSALSSTQGTLNSHINNTSNPHAVTAAQAGALVSVDGVTNAGGNVDLIPANAITIVPNDSANTVTIGETHSSRTDNPHAVTAAQAGAVALTGATMTGDLTVENLTVKNTSALLGHVGIGTGSHSDALLHVKGSGKYGFNEYYAEDDMHFHVALFENTDAEEADGIAIKLGSFAANRKNNFVTFYNGAGQVVGRIEGFDLDYTNIDGNPDGDWMPPPPNSIDLFELVTLDTGVDFTAGSISGGAFSAGSLPHLTYYNFDFGVGNVNIPNGLAGGSLPSVTFPTVTLPTVSLSTPSIGFNYAPLAAYAYSLIDWGFENGLQGMFTIDPFTLATAPLIIAASQQLKDGGLSYASKGADYAEWMPKLDPYEVIRPGYIVGVYGGKVTRKTEGAEQIMSASLAPLVLGNTPPVGEENNYLKVGFMGKVPVLVFGPVKSGDYIIPSGFNDGGGIAIPPKNMTIENMSKVLGRAWSESINDKWFNMIDVVIGVKSNEWVEVLKQHSERVQGLEGEVDTLKSEIAEIKAMLR